MDSFELNKIIGAILGTLLFVMGVGFLAEGIYAPITGQGASYDLPEPAGGATASTAAAAPVVPLAERLAKADPHAGADSVKKCQSCHDFTEGGPNKTGPDLYNIVGEKIADVPGFNFSDALKKLSNETWTYENLDHWLASPKNMAPGTKMTFVGVPDDTERANILAYLRTLSKNPVPFPTAAAAPAADAAKPAEGAAPAADAAKPAAAAPAADAAKPAATTPAPAATTTAPAATTTAPAATTPAPASSTATPAATDTMTPAK